MLNYVDLKIYICKLSFFNVLYNISFKKHLPEEDHNSWPNHVTVYAVSNQTNLHISICTGWSCFS